MIFCKKLLLSLATAAFSAFGTSEAWADNVAIHTPGNFQVLAISPNGKWACGVYVDATTTGYPFRWNLSSGSIEVLGPEAGTAWDVANDGTVSGDYPDTEVLENHAPLNLPCYWRGTTRYTLEMPKGKLEDGMGGGITPDGRFMTGTVCVNGIYTPFIWEEGKIVRSLNTGNNAVAYCISPDGQSAGGFNTLYNRTACYWPGAAEIVYFQDSEYSMGPWNYSRNFSPDGTKLLYWGGWELSEDETELSLYAVYDINTGERRKVKAPSVQSDLEYYDISNNGTLVGDNQGRGYLDVDGTGMYIDDYLEMRGVNLRALCDDLYDGDDYYVGQLPVHRIVAISEDDNVILMEYYNLRGENCSMALIMDRDMSKLPPAEIKAEQMDGLNTVAITWKRPVGANNIRGYNVYRDGKKLNVLPINQLHFYDSKLEPGEYAYTISSVTTNGVETKADDVTINVNTIEKPSPYSFFARQKGVNNVFASWKAPLANIAHKRYFDINTESFTGFAIYEPVHVETAIRYTRDEIRNYSGHKITEISFIPLGNHYSWKANFYTRNANNGLELIYSEPINQELSLGVVNTIQLSTPVELPDGDLYAAIEINVNTDYQQVIGAQNGFAVPGYSDLLRQVHEDDYFSTYESSEDSGYSLFRMSWAIDLGLTPDEGEKAELKHYNVMVNGELNGSTTATNYEIPQLADGTYTIGVEAEYSDGSKSSIKEETIDIYGEFPVISDVELTVSEADLSEVTAKWSAPTTNDETHIAHTNALESAHGMHGVSSTNYAWMIACDYQPKKLRGYDGYRISAFRFFPLSDALFTFMLYENGQKIYELEVEDMNFDEWNTYYLDEEIFLNENSEYRLVIDCFDPEPEANVFAVDNTAGLPYVSDLYSIDNGATWSSVCVETGLNGNWMMDMIIESPENEEVAIDGYDVAIDGKVVNEERILGTTFTHNGINAGNHKLNVNTYYPGQKRPVIGETKTFTIVTDGIEGVNAESEFRLVKGTNNLLVEGKGVQAVTIYSADGALAAKAIGNNVEISHLSTGVYVAVIDTINGKVKHTIRINK